MWYNFKFLGSWVLKNLKVIQFVGGGGAVVNVQLHGTVIYFEFVRRRCDDTEHGGKWGPWTSQLTCNSLKWAPKSEWKAIAYRVSTIV
jgi:hypothetical protein